MATIIRRENINNQLVCWVLLEDNGFDTQMIYLPIDSTEYDIQSKAEDIKNKYQDNLNQDNLNQKQQEISTQLQQEISIDLPVDNIQRIQQITYTDGVFAILSKTGKLFVFKKDDLTDEDLTLANSFTNLFNGIINYNDNIGTLSVNGNNIDLTMINQENQYLIYSITQLILKLINK